MFSDHIHSGPLTSGGEGDQDSRGRAASRPASPSEWLGAQNAQTGQGLDVHRSQGRVRLPPVRSQRQIG